MGHVSGTSEGQDTINDGTNALTVLGSDLPSLTSAWSLAVYAEHCVTATYSLRYAWNPSGKRDVHCLCQVYG